MDSSLFKKAISIARFFRRSDLRRVARVQFSRIMVIREYTVISEEAAFKIESFEYERAVVHLNAIYQGGPP